MNIPLEIQFRNIPDTPAARRLVEEKVKTLQRVCRRMMSCRVVLEQLHHRTNQFHVRIDITVPSGNEIVVHREPAGDKKPKLLTTVIREAFHAARAQLQELVRKQRWDVKYHREDEVQAVVAKLFKEDGYGFLLSTDGREIYFHRNSVLSRRFDDLVIGTGVRFEEEMGDEGPQASTVMVVEQLGPPVTEPGLQPATFQRTST